MYPADDFHVIGGVVKRIKLTHREGVCVGDGRALPAEQVYLLILRFVILDAKTKKYKQMYIIITWTRLS